MRRTAVTVLLAGAALLAPAAPASACASSVCEQVNVLVCRPLFDIDCLA